MNQQNCRVWGLGNPHAFVEQEQHPRYSTVWCGLLPHFFQSRATGGGRTLTVTRARYRDLLEKFLVPELRRQQIPVSRVSFQQDGAPPHTTRRLLAYELRATRIQLEGLAKRPSLRTIGDWIVLEYVLGEASLTSLRWGKMVQTTPRYGSDKV